MEKTSESQVKQCFLPRKQKPISCSFPSEPPDIMNWFPDYNYESFMLDTCDVLGGGGSVCRESECQTDGASGQSDYAADGKSDGDKREEQSLSKPPIPESLCSPSLLSEPPYAGNWFPSYEYESPALDTLNDFKSSTSEESECVKEGFAAEKRKAEGKQDVELKQSSRKQNEEGIAQKLCSTVSDKHLSSLGDVCKSKTVNKIRDSPQSSAYLSEPLEVGNWFSGYVDESTVLGESNEFVYQESEHDEDNIVNQDSIREKDMNLLKSGQNRSTHEAITDHKLMLNGFLTFKSCLGDENLENQGLDKDKKAVVKEAFSNHAITATKNAFKSILIDDGPLYKQQDKQDLLQEAVPLSLKNSTKSTNNHRKSPLKSFQRNDSTENSKLAAQTEAGLVLAGSSARLYQATGSSGRKSLHGSDNKENEVEEASGNGFVTTSKSGTRRPDENSSNVPQGSMLRSSRNKGLTSTGGEMDANVKRKVLSERTNFEHPNAMEVTGKWRCPMKSKPNIGPPLKQLRLEQWIHTVKGSSENHN